VEDVDRPEALVEVAGLENGFGHVVTPGCLRREP
jgi:hypothetical protein